MIKSMISMFLVFTVLILFVQDGIAQEKNFQYIGTKKCKMCHRSKKSGEQFRIWSESAHAKSYEVLATEKAMEVAKKMGIEDPQKSNQCLNCHVTGYGPEGADPAMYAKSFKMEEGVGCEACHGPGSEYKSMKVMKELYAGKAQAAEFGLVENAMENCTDCHNEKSPTFIGFDLEKFWTGIDHPVPEK